jgi:hypothetical protein
MIPENLFIKNPSSKILRTFNRDWEAVETRLGVIVVGLRNGLPGSFCLDEITGTGTWDIRFYSDLTFNQVRLAYHVKTKRRTSTRNRIHCGVTVYRTSNPNNISLAMDLLDILDKYWSRICIPYEDCESLLTTENT